MDLKKKGILTALFLALVMTTAVAAGVYWVTEIETATTIQEPISTANEVEFATTMYPGETNTWEFDVVNAAATVGYTINYKLLDGVDDEIGVSISAFTVGGEDELGITEHVVLEISVARDAPSEQEVELELAIGRE